jgi:hypothetical protein
VGFADLADRIESALCFFLCHLILIMPSRMFYCAAEIGTTFSRQSLLEIGASGFR